MKCIFLFFVLISLESCTSEKNIDQKANLDYQALMKLVVDKSILRKTHLNLDSINFNNNRVDTVILKTYFEGLAVSNIKDFKFEYDPFSRYYYYDYIKKDDLILFSIIHDDENGYDNLYHFIFDRSKSSILSVDLIAQTGGDGGHQQIDILDYSPQGDKLRVISISTLDEDFDLGLTRIVDSSVVNYSFGRKGSIHKEISLVSRTDTIWTK
jgi:hypothetical protein